MAESKFSYTMYRAIRWLVKLFYPRMTVVGAENLPDEAAVIVGNHCQMNGPIACELYFPTERYTWCAGQMMELKEVPAYAFEDFWSQKPKWTRPFYKLLSYIIAPLSVCVFNNANTVPVWHDMRLVTTFKRSMERLQQGASMVIFPEHDEPNNHIINRFQDRFIDLARMYHRKTGKALCFVPMYIAPRLKKMIIGKPLRFDPSAPIGEERTRICAYLMEEITKIACAQPSHTVVPYRNIPRRLYPKNTDISVEAASEKA